MTPEVDPHVTTWLDQDAEAAEADAPDLQLLWSTLEKQIDHPGWRDTLVSMPTTARMAAGLAGFGLVGGLVVANQGMRTDLTPEGWMLFAVLGGALMGVGAFTMLWSLRSRASVPRPLWPWIPAVWIVLLGFTTLAPWPGVTGVPSAMHAYCFGATTLAGLLATGWLALFEQSTSPVPARIGLLATGAGLGAFVFQCLFCPGVDVVHLLVGHSAPTLGIATVMIGLALLLRR